MIAFAAPLTLTSADDSSLYPSPLYPFLLVSLPPQAIMPIGAVVSLVTFVLAIAVGWLYFPVLQKPISANIRASWKVQLGMGQTRRATVAKERELSVAARDRQDSGGREAIRSFSSQHNDLPVTTIRMPTDPGDDDDRLASVQEAYAKLPANKVRRAGSHHRSFSSIPEVDEDEDEYKSFLDKFLSVENEYDLLPYPAFSVALFSTLFALLLWVMWASNKAQVHEYSTDFFRSVLNAPCMNDDYKSKGYCDPYSDWYDHYAVWYPEVATKCSVYGPENRSMGLSDDGAFDWTTTNTDEVRVHTPPIVMTR
jgi:hypothetical protein